MSFDKDNLLNTLVKLDSIKTLKVSVNNSLKYGAVVGAVTAMSGILGGPVGIAIGGTVSSFIVGYKSYGKFKSVPYVLLYETNSQQKKELNAQLLKLINARNIYTLTELILAMNANEKLVQIVIKTIIDFLAKEMNYKV